MGPVVAQSVAAMVVYFDKRRMFEPGLFQTECLTTGPRAKFHRCQHLAGPLFADTTLCGCLAQAENGDFARVPHSFLVAKFRPDKMFSVPDPVRF